MVPVPTHKVPGSTQFESNGKIGRGERYLNKVFLQYSSILQRFSLQVARIYCSSKEREEKKQSMYILGHYLQTDNNCHEDPEIFLFFRNESQREQKAHRSKNKEGAESQNIANHFTMEQPEKSLIPRTKNRASYHVGDEEQREYAENAEAEGGTLLLSPWKNRTSQSELIGRAQ